MLIHGASWAVILSDFETDAARWSGLLLRILMGLARDDRDPSGAMPNKKGKSMKTWQQITHYAGFDWARDHHAVVIVDVQGHIVADFEFEHTRSGWQKFREQTAAFPNLALAIETNKGAAVDQLLQQ